MIRELVDKDADQQLDFEEFRKLVKSSPRRTRILDFCTRLRHCAAAAAAAARDAATRVTLRRCVTLRRAATFVTLRR